MILKRRRGDMLLWSSSLCPGVYSCTIILRESAHKVQQRESGERETERENMADADGRSGVCRLPLPLFGLCAFAPVTRAAVRDRTRRLLTEDRMQSEKTFLKNDRNNWRNHHTADLE